MSSRYYQNVIIIYCSIVSIVIIFVFVIVVNIFAIVAVLFIVAIIIVSITGSIINSFVIVAILAAVAFILMAAMPSNPPKGHSSAQAAVPPVPVLKKKPPVTPLPKHIEIYRETKSHRSHEDACMAAIPHHRCHSRR